MPGALQTELIITAPAFISRAGKGVGLPLSGCDAFVKATGGIKVAEPAVDLGLAAALASSYLDSPVDPYTAVIGEVGLAGEVRGVSQVEHRLREAVKMGFSRAVIPYSALKAKVDPSLEVTGVRTLIEALQALGMGKKK